MLLSSGAWTDWGRAVERWLLPAECMACHQPLPTTEGDALLCRLCRVRWRPLPHPQCETCGEPSPLGLACRLCVGWPAGFGPVRSAVRLDEAARHQLHRFKYQGWSRLAESLAPSLVSLLQGSPVGSVLVPVPLASGRRRRRGYNQAEHLAIAAGVLTGIPVRAGLLRRLRETPTQTRLTPEARRANLAEAFLAIPTERPVILVDDVFTTGATLVSAAGALLDAGAPEVRAVTFARAEAPLSEVANAI